MRLPTYEIDCIRLPYRIAAHTVKVPVTTPTPYAGHSRQRRRGCLCKSRRSRGSCIRPPKASRADRVAFYRIPFRRCRHWWRSFSPVGAMFGFDGPDVRWSMIDWSLMCRRTSGVLDRLFMRTSYKRSTRFQALLLTPNDAEAGLRGRSRHPILSETWTRGSRRHRPACDSCSHHVLSCRRVYRP
jgi:hypothetical protein